MLTWLSQTVVGFFHFINDIIVSRKLILTLTKRDFKVRYLGSYLGVMWAFIQPALTILIMWFVFEVGFRAQPVSEVPFILWLSCGMIPWFFLSDAVGSASHSILENSFLVKKVVFRVSILPVVKIVSALLIHLFFITALISMFLVYGYAPSLYWFQLLYYMVAAMTILLGIAFLSSSVIIFFRDFGHIISVVMQFLFWATPIFWSYQLIPARYGHILKINPFYYIVEGYRDSLISHIGFWNRPILTLAFWAQALCLFALGALIFRRLRTHFADVI